MSEIIYLTDISAITCVVDKTKTDAVLLAARDVGARAAIVQGARGWGARERLGVWGVAVETDKDVITFMVSTEQQDVVFEAIYQVAGLDAPGRGFMYVSPLERAATYVAESIRNELNLETP